MSVARAIVKGIGLNIYSALIIITSMERKVKETTDWIKSRFYQACGTVERC